MESVTLTEGELATVAARDLGASQFFDHRDPDMTLRLSSSRIHD